MTHEDRVWFHVHPSFGARWLSDSEAFDPAGRVDLETVPMSFRDGTFPEGDDIETDFFRFVLRRIADTFHRTTVRGVVFTPELHDQDVRRRLDHEVIELLLSTSPTHVQVIEHGRPVFDVCDDWSMSAVFIEPTRLRSILPPAPTGHEDVPWADPGCWSGWCLPVSVDSLCASQVGGLS